MKRPQMQIEEKKSDKRMRQQKNRERKDRDKKNMKSLKNKSPRARRSHTCSVLLPKETHDVPNVDVSCCKKPILHMLSFLLQETEVQKCASFN